LAAITPNNPTMRKLKAWFLRHIDMPAPGASITILAPFYHHTWNHNFIDHLRLHILKPNTINNAINLAYYNAIIVGEH
jgi:hypothetical protein